MNSQERRHKMRHGVPTQRYLEFVARALLGKDEAAGDPFGLEVPAGKLDDAYVIRDSVVQAMQPGQTTITMGAEGSGKTMLFRKAVALRTANSLIVRLSLAGLLRIGEVPVSELARPLSPDAIARSIFNEYWEVTLRDVSRRAAHLDIYRKDPWWMARLRWFYRTMQPFRPDLPEEFELMTWLRAKPTSAVFSSQISAEERLREVLSFVTAEPPLQFGPGLSGARPYTRVHLFIDGIDHLSDTHIRQILDDFEWLYEMRPDTLSYTLFVSSALKDRVHALGTVAQGRITVQEVPAWTKPELEELLLRRLIAWRGWDGTLDPIHPRFDWAQWLPQDILDAQARPQFVSTIVDNAVPPPSATADPLDAPIHALHLARAFLTEAAEVWAVPASESRSALSLKQLRDLVTVYWGIQPARQED
jgi:hypothetical protein